MHFTCTHEWSNSQNGGAVIYQSGSRSTFWLFTHFVQPRRVVAHKISANEVFEGAPFPSFWGDCNADIRRPSIKNVSSDFSKCLALRQCEVQIIRCVITTKTQLSQVGLTWRGPSVGNLIITLIFLTQFHKADTITVKKLL